MLEDDDRDTFYRDYTGTMQRHLVDLLGRYLCGEEWQPMPSYIEMLHPEEQKKPAETNAEAKAHVYKIFGISKEPERG